MSLIVLTFVLLIGFDFGSGYKLVHSMFSSVLQTRFQTRTVIRCDIKQSHIL